MDEKMTFREFDSKVEMLPLEWVFFDIPEPDPGKLNFRKELSQVNITRFRQPGVVTRLIDHLKLRN